MPEPGADEGNILACYVSITNGLSTDTEATVKSRQEQGKIFRDYVWGNKGVSAKLKSLRRSDYGVDLRLILFEFYVNPLQLQIDNLKPIGNYRKKEKAIGVSIIVNEENFFSKTEEERISFLWSTILERTNNLHKKIKANKLDTAISKLTENIENLWNQLKSESAVS